MTRVVGVETLPDRHSRVLGAPTAAQRCATDGGLSRGRRGCIGIGYAGM